MNVIIVGATGFTAASFLTQALASSHIKKVWSFSRSDLPKSIPASDKLVKTIKPANEWGQDFPENADVVFSGVATTRASAGSLEKQRLIDHDLQLELAKEAKAKGCSTFVLVSTINASSNSHFGYFKMKGEIEDDIAKVGFKRVIILRPGALLGKRHAAHDGAGGSAIGVFSYFHRSWAQRLAMYPIYVDEIADATLKLLEKLPDGVHYIESKELLELTASK